MSGFAEPIIIGLAIAGGATAAYSTYQQQKTAQQQAKAEAAWHAYNAEVSERQAAAEREATAFESKQQKRKAEQLLARQRSLIGASGVTFEGSPLLVAEDTAVQLALDNINIRRQGIRRRQTYLSQSILDISKAGAAKSKAAGYGRSAVTGAGASLLSSAADVGYMGYKMDIWGK